MRVKLGDIVRGREALMDLRGAKKPAWMTIRMARMGREVDEALALFDKEIAERFKEFGHQVGDAKWEIKKEHRQEYIAWMDAFLSEEIEISLTVPITYSELASLVSFNVSDSGLASLGWLLMDDTAEPAPAPTE